MAYKCNEALAVDDGHHGRCVKRGATTMGNMFDNLGKGLNDFTKQAGKIAGNIGDTAGKITKDVAKGVPSQSLKTSRIVPIRSICLIPN